MWRPYWEVPPSIIRAELIPHILRDPDYLAKNGFEVVDGHQNVVTAGTVSSEVLNGLRSGTLSIRQQPGPKNALGLVKFVFPNSFKVYLHDTPAPEFFARSRRDFSHGCVRLEHPADLAAWVLRDNPGWNMRRAQTAMNGTTTQQVKLARPIPVLIVYGTVIVLEDRLFTSTMTYTVTIPLSKKRWRRDIPTLGSCDFTNVARGRHQRAESWIRDSSQHRHDAV